MSEYIPVALKKLVFDRAKGNCEWTPEMTKMLGLTPTGRATIELLETNRESVVNMRHVLAMMGFHPPDEE